MAAGEVAAQEETAEEQGGGLSRLEQDRIVYGTTFISPLVEVFGDVFVGQGVFVAGNTILRASPELRLEIGDETNAQDNIIVRSLDESSRIGRETSLAHHAIVRDSELGNFAFVGFNAVVDNSRVGDGCLIQAGARVVGVELAEDSVVAPGQVVEDQATADALPKIDEASEEFKREVLDVNAEFAESYIELYESEGYESLIGIGPQPSTSFNPEPVLPQLPEDIEIGEFVRIVGDVRVGAGTSIRQRTAIRADEGAPTTIGSGADIRNRVAFHALKDTQLVVGDGLFADDDVVIHGPLEAGNNLWVGRSAVVFRAIVEDDVTVGERTVIQGPALEEGEELSFTIPAGSVIPDGAVVTDEESLRQALTGVLNMPETGGMDPGLFDPHGLRSHSD